MRRSLLPEGDFVRLTPLDIQNHRFATRMRGCDPSEVDAFLRLVAEDFEGLVRESDGLREQVRNLENRVEDEILEAVEARIRSEAEMSFDDALLTSDTEVAGAAIAAPRLDGLVREHV